jgi:hypothetical protein
MMAAITTTAAITDFLKTEEENKLIIKSGSENATMLV